MSGRRAPDAGGAVGAGGGDALAVGEERHAVDARGVALVSAQLLTARRVPDAHVGVEATAGDYALAVRRKRGAEGVRAPDLLQRPARPHVQDAQAEVGARQQQTLAV